MFLRWPRPSSLGQREMAYPDWQAEANQLLGESGGQGDVKTHPGVSGHLVACGRKGCVV